VEPKLDGFSFENRPEIAKNPAFSVSLNIGGGELTNENYPLAKGQVISEYNFGVSLDTVIKNALSLSVIQKWPSSKKKFLF
jgi:hypothetical protein